MGAGNTERAGSPTCGSQTVPSLLRTIINWGPQSPLPRASYTTRDVPVVVHLLQLMDLYVRSEAERDAGDDEGKVSSDDETETQVT
jgi:hypothetical protein